MEAQDIGFIIASIGGLICSVIYAMKHIKKSECCGSRCTQDTGDCENPSKLQSSIV
mgnify:CR=1 FL=1